MPKWLRVLILIRSLRLSGGVTITGSLISRNTAQAGIGGQETGNIVVPSASDRQGNLLDLSNQLTTLQQTAQTLQNVNTYTATSGDIHLATREDFFMATDKRR